MQCALLFPLFPENGKSIPLFLCEKKKKKKKQLQSFNFNSGGSYFLVWVVGRDLRPKNIISLILKRANRYVGRSPRETTRNQNLACLTCDQS